MIVDLSPQPIVVRIQSGWDISGRPYFMGCPEDWLNKDERFQAGRPAGFVPRWAGGMWRWFDAEEAPCYQSRHQWKGKVISGSYDRPHSLEWVKVCEVCGLEDDA